MAHVTREPEAVLQRKVVELAELLRYRVYHTHDSRRSVPGFPDLVLCRPPRLLFAELKSDRGNLTPDQVEWLAILEECAAPSSHVWRPADWPTIERTLGVRTA